MTVKKRLPVHTLVTILIKIDKVIRFDNMLLILQIFKPIFPARPAIAVQQAK